MRRYRFMKKPLLSVARLANLLRSRTRFGISVTFHLDAGRLELAEPCYHEALTSYRGNERTAPLDLANAIRPLAILKEQKGEVKEARSLWTDAKALYAAVDVHAGVAESSRHIAHLS
jgi:hypothetical protein